MKQIKMKLDERILIAGGTGSGKTHLGIQIISEYVRATRGLCPVYVIDSKLVNDFDIFIKKGLAWVHEDDNTPPPPFFPDGKKIPPICIWKTASTDETSEGVFGQFFMNVFQTRKPCVVFADELSSFCGKSGRSYPRSLDLILKQGRALHQTLITCTQELAFIPRNLVGQASKMFRLNLNTDYDIKKLAGVMGKAVEQPPKHEFGFWFRDLKKPVNINPPQYFKDMQEFFGL